MAITAINVTMQVQPLNNPCPPPGGKFNLTVKVFTQANGIGGSYYLYIYDDDNGPDTELVALPATQVPAGNKTTTHSLVLECDTNCFVAGASAAPATNQTSGERSPQIYAYARSVQAAGINDSSVMMVVSCGSPPPSDDKGRRPTRKKVPQKKKVAARKPKRAKSRH